MLQKLKWKWCLASVAMVIAGSVAMAEWRYCSWPVSVADAPAGTPDAPQGCWRSTDKIIGAWLKKVPTTPPTDPGNAGKIVARCTSLKASDHCYDTKTSDYFTQYCNRVQVPCGDAQIYMRGTDASGNFTYGPLPSNDDYTVVFLPGYSSSTQFNCNDIYWLEAQTGPVTGGQLQHDHAGVVLSLNRRSLVFNLRDAS